MQKTDTIDNLKGFGSGGMPGEFEYSQNMIPGRHGLEAFIALSSVSVSGSPGRINWFAERAGQIYGVDTTGKIFANIASNATLQRNPLNSSGNGLLVDQKNRLLYARNQYLGKYDGTTWDDVWKDFGSSIADPKGGDTYEDWVVVPHGNKLAMLNVNDDSWNASAFTLPDGFTIPMVRSNRTGILVAANLGSRGVLILWDARTLRSINEWIWFDQKIQSICKAGDGWIVTTMKEQWLTNGYTLVRKLPGVPDTLMQSQNFQTLPGGTLYSDGKLLTANTDTGALYTRKKSGLYLLDLAITLYSFVPSHTHAVADMTMGAVFQDSAARTWTSYSTNLPSSQSYVAELKNAIPSRAVLVTGALGKGPGTKVAQSVKPDFGLVPTAQTLLPTATADVSVKIYNFRRQLWAWGSTSAISAAVNQLAVNGLANGQNNAVVGDEVTVLSGLNAGSVRHITAISGQNTATEVWTLDSDLAGLTENGVLLNMQPFQLVKKHTVSATNLKELDDLLFSVRNRIKGKKFLVKFVIDNITELPLIIQSISLTYDDQGINTTQ